MSSACDETQNEGTQEGNQTHNQDENNLCGWFNFRAKFLQKFKRPGFLLFFLCAYFFTNSVVITGIFSSSISTIEKRFNLSSKQMGIITSIYDVAALIFTGPISYFAAKNKPKWLSIGMLTMGIGYVIFILPHFIESRYIPPAASATSGQLSNMTNNLLCQRNISTSTLRKCTTASANDVYYYIFLLAMFVAGAGCTPMISLGIPFLDESVSRKTSAIYVGIFQTSGIVAAIVGFLVASVFLNIFVHPEMSVNITSKNSQSWIGAWWLGFALGAIFALLVSIFLSAFPKEIDSKYNEPNEKKIKADDNKKSKPAPENNIWKSMKILLANSTFVFLCMTVSFENFIFSGISAFLPKLSVFQFNLTPSRAGVLFGLLPGTGALLGNLAGSLVQKRFSLSPSKSLKFCVIVQALTLMTGSFLFLHCDNSFVAGIDVKYKTTSVNNSGSIIQNCNSNCNCPASFFRPICAEKVTYFSPCHAGCTNVSSSNNFVRCSCLNGNNLYKRQNVKFGACKSSCGANLYLFFGACALNSFLSLMIANPMSMVTLRCVPFGLRSFAVGIQWITVRVLGSIPGPILIGYLIDKNCLFWSKSCKSTSSCLMYRNRSLAITLGVTFLSVKLISMICNILALISQRRKDKKTGEHELCHIDSNIHL